MEVSPADCGGERRLELRESSGVSSARIPMSLRAVVKWSGFTGGGGCEGGLGLWWRSGMCFDDVWVGEKA